MKKLSKILFLLVIMSAGMFTSCIDYVDTRLPPYPDYNAGVVGQTHVQFENIVRDRMWYSRLYDDSGFKVQKVYFFNVVDHNFTITTYRWTNIGGSQWGNRTVESHCMDYIYYNQIGKILYKPHGDRVRYDGWLNYIVEGAYIITFNGRQFFVPEVFENQSVKNYTEELVFNM